MPCSDYDVKGKERIPNVTGRSRPVTQGPIKGKVLIAIQRKGKVFLGKFGQPRIVHARFLDNSKYGYLLDVLTKVCGKDGQGQRLFATKESSGPSDDKAKTANFARKFMNYLV